MNRMLFVDSLGMNPNGNSVFAVDLASGQRTTISDNISFGAGPSGFAYCGAAGWSKELRGRFFHCNYTGNGGIESIRLKAKGAAFEIETY